MKLAQKITISELFTNYFNESKKNKTIPGLESSQYVDQNAIEKCSLSFITQNCGQLNIKITDNANLDEDIMDLFAQTFVRYFWNNSIGYDNELSFWFKLRAFFDENLPLWAQFFKETIIRNKALITSVSISNANNTDTLHVEGTNTTKDSTKSNGKNESELNGKGTQINSNLGNGKTTTTGNNKLDENTKNKQLNANADTPQDQLGMNLNGGDPNNPLSGYNFDYASNVNGVNGNTSHNSEQNNKTVEENSNNGQANVNNTNNQKTNGTNDSTINTDSKNENKSDQTRGSNSNQNIENRNINLFDLANQMNSLANGAYMNLFIKMKREGLFLLVY